ncbi:hypothetical protein Tsubulata_026574 [Turnera subulata]|uniref:DUF7887 domain-containing protein n=1 Tax=Turnera subulata TaxID=218843 RepID=A0A9Q0FXL2_9ROSI|nr:hypothetical protein Tsubulata_026574 [Turnera subulata]
MVAIETTPFFINLPVFHHRRRIRRKCVTILAKKRDLSDDDSRPNTKPAPFFSLRAAKTIFARSLVVALGLGFVDAGYSGDWSRIGVISRETEDLLKIAAFVVVPLCLFVLFSKDINREQ